MEDRVIICPKCGCEEDMIFISTCIVCGEEYCTMCESMESPDMCECCEYDIDNEEDN